MVNRDVPAVSVKLVLVEIFHAILVPAIVTAQVPLPILRARTLVPEPLNVLMVGLLLFMEKSRVPVKVPIDIDETVML